MPLGLLALSLFILARTLILPDIKVSKLRFLTVDNLRVGGLYNVEGKEADVETMAIL